MIGDGKTLISRSLLRTPGTIYPRGSLAIDSGLEPLVSFGRLAVLVCPSLSRTGARDVAVAMHSPQMITVLVGRRPEMQVKRDLGCSARVGSCRKAKHHRDVRRRAAYAPPFVGELRPAQSSAVRMVV